MVCIELTSEEAEKLHQLIESCLADLRDEIRHTDKKGFRAVLKSEEAFLRKLLQHLEGEGVKATV